MLWLCASALFGSFLYLLIVKLVTGFFHSSPKFIKYLYYHYLELCWVDCLPLLHLVLKFYLVP